MRSGGNDEIADIKRYRIRRLAEGAMREEQNSCEPMLANEPHGHEMRRDTYIINLAMDRIDVDDVYVGVRLLDEG